MYPNYFGLREPSFSIAPDPQYLFLSEQHREALAHLLYGAGEHGGFVLLTGEVGTGKTTVCRAFLEQLPEGVDVAWIINPALTAEELLLAICDEFRVAVPPGEPTVKRLLDCLNDYLLAAHAAGRRPVLMIDEAQNLRPRVMEQVRLLTNLETTKTKLLQIFLIGQPELRRMLARDSLRQLNQRITARFHLRPLTAAETAAYIRHRVAVAGVERPLFTPAAIRRIHEAAGGVPRLINILCDRALLGACVDRMSQVTPPVVARAAREVQGEGLGGAPTPVVRPSFAVAAAVALVLAAGWLNWERLGGGVLEWYAAHLMPGPSERAEPAGPTAVPGRAPAPVVVAAPPRAGVIADALPAAGIAGGGAPAAVASGAGAAWSAGVALAVQPQAPGPVTAPVPARPLADGPAASLPLGAVVLAESPVAPVQPRPVAAGAVPSAVGSVDGAAIPGPGDAAGPVPLPRVALATAGVAQTQTSTRTLNENPAETLATAALPEEAALRVLLRRWGFSIQDLGSGDPCGRLAVLGLRCERERGRLSHVRYFDRPVLVRLRDPGGARRYAVLGLLDETSATLDFPEGSATLPISALEAAWTGDYTVVWQPPPTGASEIGPGAAEESVRWLRRTLSEVPDSGLVDNGLGRFDAGLSAALRRFQTARGLAADGIAGPRTLVQLANAVALPVPRLMSPALAAAAAAQAAGDSALDAATSAAAGAVAE